MGEGDSYLHARKKLKEHLSPIFTGQIIHARKELKEHLIHRADNNSNY